MVETAAQLRIGIDLGGTKTEVILLSGANGELFRTRIPTVRDDYAATIEAVAGLVAQAEAAAGIGNLPVGVGIPGTVSRKSGLVNNCLAVSEATDGAGKGHDLVFAGILGTGCGAGLAWRGQPIVGPNGVAGEWGHNPLPWTSTTELQARPCYCGKTGCQETFLSGTGLCLTYQRLTGEKLTGPEIIERVAEGDGAAINTLEDYLDALARGLAGVINVLDPDVIVLGGGASNIAQIYSMVPTLLPRYVFGGECDTPIVQAVHGDSSGVRGAAWLNPL